MITLESHTEINAREQYQIPEYSCCRSCHRMFQPSCVDQLSMNLCDRCFDLARGVREAVPQARVKVRPRVDRNSKN